MAESQLNRGMRPPAYPIQRVYGQIYPFGQAVEDMFYFHKCDGLDYSDYLLDVPPTKSPLMTNWRLDRGTLVQRPGTSLLGPGSANMVIGLVGFQTSTGTSYIVRITRTTIEIYDPLAQVWNLATGPAILTTAPYSISSNEHAYTTGWADHLIIQYDDGPMYELNLAAGTYVLVTTTGAVDPSGRHTLGKHITTFAGRVIVCQADFPYRIAWSVKNNNTDWSGIGSGFEDLFSTPGGSADPVLCCIPVTDDQAIVVRENTIWMMATTGNADAPFRFSRLYDKIACKAAYGCCPVPGGVIVPGLDDIYLVTTAGIQAIGKDIRTKYLQTLFNPDKISSTFDEKRGEFVMGVSEGSRPYLNVVYRYNVAAQGWSRDEYQAPVKLISYTRTVTGLPTIIQLIGTIDGLVGPIASLGSTAQQTGVMFSSPQAGTPGSNLRIQDLLGLIGDLTGRIGRLGILPGSSNSQIWREDPIQVQDYDADFILRVDIPTVITTGLLTSSSRPPGMLQREKVVDAQLEFIDTQDPIPVNIDWSPDGGITWNQFSRGNIAQVANGPQVLRFTGTFEAAQPIVRMTTPSVAGMRMNGLHLFVVDGGKDWP